MIKGYLEIISMEHCKVLARVPIMEGLREENARVLYDVLVHTLPRHAYNSLRVTFTPPGNEK